MSGSSKRIAEGRMVVIAYSIADADGNTIDECSPDQPLSYVHGEGQILPALERAIEGQTPGFRKSMRLEAKEAYGIYRPELVVEVPRESFGNGVEPRIGMKFDTTGPDTKPISVRVIELTEKTVILDGNHPLAGIGLNVDVRVIDVRDPTEEERGFGPIAAKRRSDLH